MHKVPYQYFFLANNVKLILIHWFQKCFIEFMPEHFHFIEQYLLHPYRLATLMFDWVPLIEVKVDGS